MGTEHPRFQHDISAHKSEYLAESYGTKSWYASCTESQRALMS